MVRVVSEITESNGSSSMASVCGSSLAMMDAGVPLKAPVAGIAMGLVKEGGDFVVLSDILGDEDHLGDMDFKVAGSADGISALQMDIKIDGITEEIMKVALEQAKRGRLHILGEMAKVHQHRPLGNERVRAAPDHHQDPSGQDPRSDRQGWRDHPFDHRGDRYHDRHQRRRHRHRRLGQPRSGRSGPKRIEQIVSDVEPGRIYEGKVAKLMDFGAFVTIMPGKDGLVHVSQISDERVEKVSDKLKEGDIVKVKVLEVDKQGRIRLSMKAVTEDERRQRLSRRLAQGDSARPGCMPGLSSWLR